MTTATTVLLIIRCPNGFCSWHGKSMGTIEVSPETESVTDTRQCWKCKQTHRQVLRLK